MSGSQYRYLFNPLAIGPVTVANRLVFSAHLTNYAEHGRPSEQHAAYYAARAAGGAGLIITEEHSVHPTDWPYEKMIHGFHDDVLPGYRRITEAVHAHGVPIFAQINHNGGQASSMYTRLPVWGPSPVADPLFREVPKAIDHAEIAEVVAGYADVAARCKAGGFDGIELQCSHSSIVRGFLSRATNKRTDEYGGSLDNRARLLHEIVAAVRDAIGRDLALGVRLCGDELIDDGITIDETVEVARQVEAHGHVDYINTSIGVATATLFMIEASMHIPPDYAMFIPSAIRKAVDLPVVGVGRFKDPLQAERALAQGHADLIGVVRGQIADAEFVAKARAGHHHDIRLCLSCNQECVGRMGLNRWLGCIENPVTGREASQPVRLRPSTPRHVVVIGGGPAGMQTAIAAARTGNRVTVLERDEEPGGQVRWAARVPNRAEFGDLVRNQVHECELLGVDVRTGVEATAELVDSLAPDAVVVATGSVPARPWWAPPPLDGDGPRPGELAVIDVTDVVTGRFSPEGHVIVIDEVGFHQATSVAELLADRGCQVDILSPGMVVGQDLGITLDMENWWLRATSKGIGQVTDQVIVGLEGVDLQVLHHPTGVTTPRTADWVVLAVPGSPADALYFELRDRYAGSTVSVDRVGDCVAPRRAHAAVIEGNRVVGTVMLAVLPVRDGSLPLGGAEAVAEVGGEALVVGPGAAAAARLLDGVATNVRWAELPEFAPALWAAALSPLVGDADVVVLPGSPDGRDLAPRLAHLLRRPLLAGAMSIADTGATIAVEGGLVLHELVVDGPFVATLQPGVRGVDPDPALVAAVTFVDSWPAIATRDPELVELVPADPATMDLAESPRIVGGGAGLGDQSVMDQLGLVADALGCSTGGTRVITDWGWLPFERQIGTTGVMVHPRLYLAFGVSGAVQHVAGLGDPTHVIAVNTDASCPMMSMADLAVVTDGPALVAELARRLGVPVDG